MVWMVRIAVGDPARKLVSRAIRALCGGQIGDCAPLDPVKLPLSLRLRARLTRWCARFQESFETEIDLDAFASEGRAIAQAVKKELPDWSIVYFDEDAAARSGYRGSPSTYEEEIS
jgi:hypothetical protein